MTAGSPGQDMVKDIHEGCAWCGAQETIYHFVKSCPMVRMLYAVCRDIAMPVVKGVDAGRWVADDPIIVLTNPTRLCVWWGLHCLWTLRCQKAVRRMEVDTLTVIMSLGVTFIEARVWFRNTRRAEAPTTAQRMSSWFWEQWQHMLGEDPSVQTARTRLTEARVAAVGAEEAQEQRSKQQ